MATLNLKNFPDRVTRGCGIAPAGSGGRWRRRSFTFSNMGFRPYWM